MSPCVGTDEFLQFRITGQMLAGQLLFGDEALSFKKPGQLAHKTNPVHHGIKIFVATLGEVAKIDLRCVARIGRAQCHLSGMVPCVRFQNDPGQVIQIRREFV